MQQTREVELVGTRAKGRKRRRRRRGIEETKKPLNRRIPRAADPAKRSGAERSKEREVEKRRVESLPNGHLPFRRTSAAGSMAAPHFHDRAPLSLPPSLPPRRCIECVHPCVLPLAPSCRTHTQHALLPAPPATPASSALVRRARRRISNLFPRGRGE